MHTRKIWVAHAADLWTLQSAQLSAAVLPQRLQCLQLHMSICTSGYTQEPCSRVVGLHSGLLHPRLRGHSVCSRVAQSSYTSRCMKKLADVWSVQSPQNMYFTGSEGTVFAAASSVEQSSYTSSCTLNITMSKAASSAKLMRFHMSS